MAGKKRGRRGAGSHGSWGAKRVGSARCGATEDADARAPAVRTGGEGGGVGRAARGLLRGLRGVRSRPESGLVAGSPEPGRNPALRWIRVGLPGPLVLSLIVHAVVLAALGHVAFRPTAANATRYTRVRMMKWDAARNPARPLEVSLPGGRARPVALPTPAAPDPVAEELQREAERIAELRADFFGPMRIATLPMPVLPGFAGDVPPPPFWDVPLRGDLSPLPPPGGLCVDPGARQGPQPQEDVGKPSGDQPMVVHTPDEPAPPAPVEMAEAAAGPMVSVPDERPSDAAAGDPAAEGIQSPAASAVVARAEPGVAAGLPQDPAAVSTDPGGATALDDSAVAPGTGMPVDGIVPAPDSGGEDAAPVKDTEVVAAGPKEGEPPVKTVEAPAKEGVPAEAAAVAETQAPDPSANAPESPAPAVVMPSEPGPTVASAGGEQAGGGARAAGAVPVEPPRPDPGPHIPTGGTHAGLTGSFRVPLGVSLPGGPASGAMAALLKEVGRRTALKVTAAGRVTPEAIPADAPLVYLRGTGKMELTPEQRAALEAYVRKGGTLFVDGAAGESGESIVAELERLFGSEAARVPTTHALYTAHYRIPGAPGAKLFPLKAIRVAGRPAVLISAALLGRRWQSAADPEHESAVALGVNLLVHAAAGRK